MKVRNLIMSAVIAASMALSSLAQAEESGFSFDDSIRHQVFVELKSNVETLFERSHLLVPAVDTSAASRIVSRKQSSGNVLPAGLGDNDVSDDDTVELIN